MQKTDQLHRAIQVELLPEVKKLVEDGASMDSILGMRGTALCAAIETRNYDITKYLLESGCDVNAQDYDGEPPLLLATRKESPGKICGKKASLEIIKLIMDHPKCNLNKIDPLTKKSALHFATEQKMVQVVKWLLNNKSSTKCDINMVDANGNTPLHLAVLEGHSEVVEILVDHSECFLKVYNKAGVTPLHVCARNGDIKNMQCLLSRIKDKGSKRVQLEKSIRGDNYSESELDINLNAISMYEKETCLHIAARQGHADVVEILLENGARVDIKNNLENTPLLLSITSTAQWQTMNNKIPRLLLKKGANPNLKFNRHQCRYVHNDLVVTPLILAARNNNLELVKLLLASGVDVNMTDSLGQTALYIALKEQSFTVASYLLSECASININLRTDCGDTCLHALVHRSQKQDSDSLVDMVKLMIRDKGAVLVRNIGSETAVDGALRYEDHVLIQAILEEIDVDMEEYLPSGEKLHELMFSVADSGNIELLKVLLSFGIDIDMKFLTVYKQQGRVFSYLYLALECDQYKMAEFFVVNGVDLCKEIYIFADVEDECLDKSNDEAGANNTDDEAASNDGSDDDDDFLLGSDDDCDIFHGNVEFRSWIQNIATNPRSLQLNSLTFIRKYFINHQIPFKHMKELSLPSKLIKMLRYQN